MQIKPPCPISSPAHHETYISAIAKHLYLQHFILFYRSVSLAQSIPSTLNTLPCLLNPLKAICHLQPRSKRSLHKACL